MKLQGASDAIMCRAFPLTLGDKAQKWFRRMYERSVKILERPSHDIPGIIHGVQGQNHAQGMIDKHQAREK